MNSNIHICKCIDVFINTFIWILSLYLTEKLQYLLNHNFTVHVAFTPHEEEVESVLLEELKFIRNSALINWKPWSK